ncbi:MAG: dicarboxylate/amino acid:cation symporter [Nitrospirota bacterium]|jgi:solute carrier family 1 (high affinity glutamate transporter) protein 1
MTRTTILLLAAIVAGVVCGSLWPVEMGQVAWLGDLFLALLKLLVVPLVVTSMIAGIAGLGDVRRLGPIGGWTIAYYLSTTFAAVLVGLMLVNLVQPGTRYATPYDRALAAFGLPEAFANVDDLLHHRLPERRIQKDRALQLIVDDPHMSDDDPRIAAAVEALGLHRFPEIEEQLASGDTDPANALRDALDLGLPEVRETLKRLDIDGHPELAERLKRHKVMPLEAVDVLLAERHTGPTAALKSLLFTVIPPNIFQAAADTNILALILFSLVFGGVCTTLGERGAALLGLFRTANDAVMRMVHLVMAAAPVGIFALVAGKLAAEGGGRAVVDLAISLAAYAAVVTGGLLLHATVVLPTILRFLGRRSPLAYFGAMLRALVTAFATASSSATLPISMECAEEGGVRPRSAGFVMPLGATINMDGTALYEAVAVMFIAQVYGIPMGPAEQVIIFLTATLAAIGAAGIPEAGLVTMVMVLSAVHLPVGGVALILTIDWLLDRLRTTVNVWGDAVGAAVIDRVDGEGLGTRG